jgi:signal transduction histidine kinase
MPSEVGFRHLGGGRKGLFLLLRYLFIIAASYLLIFQAPQGSFEPTYALMIAVALASNVALSFIKADLVFSWYVEAPVLIADTLWVSWALSSTGTIGQEFFLLYFFVLFIAAMGESVLMVLFGSTAVSIANIYFTADTPLWTSPHVLRVIFFYAVALFYGNVISEIRRERQRANKGLAWAHELEAKVAERTEELQRLYSEALAANRVKSEFVATMSHELRSPLNVIMGYTDLLLDGEFGTVSQQQAEILARVTRKSRELLELINETLDLNRLEAGKLEVERSQVDVVDLLRVIDDETRDQRDKPGVSFSLRLPAELPLLYTDPGKVKTVLRNLISNAIKFTEQGSVTVTARVWRSGVEVAVADTGIGIPAEARAFIFEPFRQVDSSMSRRHGGVGLGLYIVKRLLDLLGGSVVLESEVGRGSTFRVWLPADSGVRPGHSPVAQSTHDERRVESHDPIAPPCTVSAGR